jgi:O-antigen/teichoic acid export membrane protein
VKRGEIAQSVSRGAFYLTIEKGAALVSGVAYFALLLRWLGPTKYGIMTLALSFAGLATMVSGNSEAYLERFAAEYQARGQFLTLRRAHLVSMGIKLVLGSLSALVLSLGAGLIARKFYTPELGVLLPLLGAVVALDGFSTTGRAMLYGMQQFRWLSVVSVGFHVAKTLMVGQLWWWKQGLVSLAIGLSALTVAQGVVSVLIPLWMLRGAKDPEDTPSEGRAPRVLLRSMVSYCLPLLGARVTFLSGQNLGKIVLGKLFPPIQLGYFSFAFQTVERFVEVVYALPSSLLPSFTKLVAQGERARLGFVFDQSLRLIQVVALALSCALLVFAPEITLLVGSPLFEPAIPLLRIMALVPVARTAQQPLTMLFQALRLPGAVLGLALLKFATEFGCYFTLVPILGMMGAGWANLAGAVVSYVMAMLLVGRFLPEGGSERASATFRSLLVFLPLLGLGLFLETRVAHLWSLALRLAMIPTAVVAVFALRLVRSEDIDRLNSFPLESAWMRRTRDVVMAGLQGLARALTPRRAT